MHALLKPWAEIETIQQKILNDFDLPVSLRTAFSERAAWLVKTRSIPRTSKTRALARYRAGAHCGRKEGQQ
jgi:hypothetical protein